MVKVSREVFEPDEEQPGPKLVEAKVVAYVGTSTIREISSESWDRAGVEDQKTIVWEKRNGWKIPLDQFTDEALSWMDNNEPDLMIQTVEVPR